MAASQAQSQTQTQALFASMERDADLSARDCLRRLFVAALTEQSDTAWKNVLEYSSKLSASDRHQLSKEPDVLHYVYRTLDYASSNDISSSHLDLIQPMNALFPAVVEQCKKQSRSVSYNVAVSTCVVRNRKQRPRKRVVSLDSGLKKLLTYSPQEIAATFRGPELQLSDLVPAATAVSNELTLQTKTGLSPSHHFSQLPDITSDSPLSRSHKPYLSPVYHHQLDTEPPHTGAAATQKMMTKIQKGKSPESKLQTAYDVIAAFASGSLQAGAESIYLNCYPSTPWNPYNLTVVSKTRANQDHYLISKFGILHVQPGESSDLQSFADWLREAGLFTLCQQIPYFRQFLTRKMFHTWHRNVCYRQFVKIFLSVNQVGIRFFPEFNTAIDKIHKLNTELLNIPTHTLKPFGNHLGGALEKNSEEMKARTHRLLQRYFKYCKRVVSETINETKLKAERLEEEKKHQPFVSDSPISVQVAQHAELEHKLGVARYRASRLSDFVCLAEQMMGTCLLQMARQSGKEWVEEILHLMYNDGKNASSSSLDIDERGSLISEEGSESTDTVNGSGDIALLLVELKIGENGGVVTQPSTEKIAELLTNPLQIMTRLITSITSTVTPLTNISHHTPSQLLIKTDEVIARRRKPLLQALKGINIGGDGCRPGCTSESSRARSRLEEVQTQGTNDDKLSGGEYSTPNSPLVSQNMQKKLQQDPVLHTLYSNLKTSLTGLMSEISAACHCYSWLDHANSLINNCRKEKTSKMSATDFKIVLGELHSVLSRVNHLPHLLPTSHSLVTISTVSVASQLEPQLHQAILKLQSSIASQALETATRILKETAEHTQMLSMKRYDLEGFVEYARSLHDSQSFHTREAANTQWVTDIYNTLKNYKIDTFVEARDILQQLQGVWERFEDSLTDGEQFVKKQTPIKAQGLQEGISLLEEQLEQLLMMASEGDFIDPTATPHLLLTRLESIQQEMSGIRSRLMELSKWEEAITGKHHDLSRTFHCFDVLFARQELWKYQRQFESCWYDWTRIPFKKIDVTYLEKKVDEWWSVCDKLATKLPSDPVLEQWREKVERMYNNLSILQLLSSRNIQTSHWHTIFAGFNEQYDPHQGYTLEYFLDRDLEKFSDLISEVHGFASQQSRLREKFVSMEKEWEEKKIELLQTSVDQYPFCLRPSQSSQRQTTITFYDPSDSSPVKSGSHGPEASSHDQLHSVHGGEMMKEEIEAALLELNVMLSSPHLGGLKGKVQLLRSSVQQVNEIFSLLLHCQNKWQDLLELFLHTKPSLHKSCGLQKLQSASAHFKEVMESVHGDPRLFSLLSKSRGRKGVRDLQGPELRKKLMTILECMEAVMLKLCHRLDEAVCQWPRLGYLTKDEVVKTIAYRGDILPIIPLINKVFPSIKTLHFLKSSSKSKRDLSTGYQVTGVEGKLGEQLCLVLPLSLEQKPAVEWLAGLERAVCFSLGSRLTDCLATLPSSLSGHTLNSGVDGVLSWLQDHIEQNIILALDIHWSKCLLQSNADRSNLHEICSQIERALENSVQLLLRQMTQHHSQEETRDKDDLNNHRVLHTLRSIIIYLRRKSDFARSLLATNDTDAAWQFHIHYTTDLVVDNESRPCSGAERVEENLRMNSTAITSRVSLTDSRTSLTSSKTGEYSREDTRLTSQPPTYTSSRSSMAGETNVSVYSSPRDPLHISPVTACTVHIGQSSVAYSFEYHAAPTSHIVMTPLMESGVIKVASAIVQYSFPVMTGEQESQKIETVKEATRILGRHHYHYTCTSLTSAVSLLHIIHTALSSGSILSIAHPHILSTAIELKLRQYLQTLQAVLAASHTLLHSPHLSAQQSARSAPRTPNVSPSRIVTSQLDWYAPLPSSVSSQPHSLEHMGHTVIPNHLFGCCVISESSKSNQLETGFTSVPCMKPDDRLTVEIFLLSYGFSSAYQLSSVLVNVSKHLQFQLGMACRGVQFKLSWLQRVVSLAAHYLHTGGYDFNYQDSEKAMELCVMSRAVLEVTTPLLPPHLTNRVTDIIARHLPRGELRAGGEDVDDGELVKAAEEEMKERHLQIQPDVIEKIVQLHHSLGQYHCTILLGPQTSGISTCYRTLSAAYKRMGKPPANITVINPAAYSWEQLIGGYSTDDFGVEQWTNGILTRLLLNLKATETPANTGCNWIVLDGPLTPHLLDTFTTLISEDGLCLPTLERVKIPLTCRLLLKPGCIPSFSPALVGSCALLHWSCDTLTPEMLVDSWLDRAPTQHDLTALSISFLASVLQSMVPDSLQYLDRVCSKHYGYLYTSKTQNRVQGVAETLSLLGLLSAMLERNCPTREGTTAYSGYGSRSSSSLRSISAAGSMTSSRCGSAVSQVLSMADISDDQLPPLATDDTLSPDHRGPSEMDFTLSPSNSVENQMLSILCFAFIWSIGAYVPFSEVDSFNEFAMEQINDMPVSVSFPDEGSVFDYYLDLQTYKFEPWSGRKGRLAPKSNGYIPTPELTRVAYVTEVYLSYGHNVLLLGDRGSGKTSFVESLLQSNLSLTQFPITRSMTAPQLHTALFNKVTEVTRVDKMRWGSRKIGITGQKCLFFLDDIHLSNCNSYLCDNHNSNLTASIPELVSFSSHHCCLYNFPDDNLCYTHNVQYIASSLPGHHYTHLTQLLGSFHPVPFFPLTDDALHTIFSTSLKMWFKKFPNAAIGETETLAKAFSVASVVSFRSVCDRLCPSPFHPEWFISLKHLMDIFKGIMLIPLDSKPATRLSTRFGAMNRSRGTTPSTPARSSHLKTEKSARKSSNIVSRKGTARHKVSQSVHLPPVKKAGESNLRSKIKSELKGKKQHHDSSEIQATIQRLVRLWCHETTRVYADRMTENSDRAWFVRLLETCVKYCFCGVDFEKNTGHKNVHGGRPMRGARGRGVTMASQQSIGLNLSKLMNDGVRADILQTLLPRVEVASEGATEERQLIPLDQAMTRGEDVTALIFCKLPAAQTNEVTSADEGSSNSEDEDADEMIDTPSDSVYQELGDGQVLETMENHLHRYSTQYAKQTLDDSSTICPAPDIVLFQQAMEHATRLCRAMIIPRCHALLLGINGSGRKSLCRLVAYMMKAKLFEVGANDADDYKEVLKKACYSAATTLIPTILLVSCSHVQCYNTHMWSNITQIMKGGICSGLFTNAELIRIQNVLRRDHSKKAITAETIARLIQHNLHVVIAWDIDRVTESPIPTETASQNGSVRLDPKQEEMTRDVFSMLCSQCSVVDHYQTWRQRELCEVAQRWWREKTCSLDQGWVNSESQLESLAGLAAHIHLSSLSTLEQTLSHHPALLISPTSYTQTLTMAHTIAMTLTDKEKKREEKMCLALKKLASGEEDKKLMEKELLDLEPELKDFERQLQEKENYIEACQDRYKSASQHWIEAKEIIASKTESTVSLRSTVAEKMNEVSSLHSSAMEALTSVKKNDVLEVMSYREPPASAIPVFNSLCMLFDRPQTWEECKLLLLSPNFFESLKFFDKDHIPRQKLRQLKVMLKSPLWRDETLQHSSKAVSSLAMWVAALLDYHHARDIVKPFQDKLATAEDILTKAQVTLVEKQKVMLETKAEFKRSQKERSGIRKQKADIEAKITAVEQRVSDANRLLKSLSPWKSYWEEKQKAIHRCILSSPGHALLVAASTTYLSCVPADKHSQLWECWLGYCAGRIELGSLIETSDRTSYHSHQARVQIESDFSPVNILATEEERSHWNHYASFPGAIVLEKCIAARKSVDIQCCPLPLVLDPHQLFHHFAHELEFHRSSESCRKETSSLAHQRSQHPASCVEVVRMSNPEWSVSLCEMEEMKQKPVVLILDKLPSNSDRCTLKSILKRQSEGLNKCAQTVPPERMFRLYLVLEQRISAGPSVILQSLGLKLLEFNVVNMELSNKALEFHLLKHTLRVDHPEYAVRHRALLVDRTFYENQIENSKEQVITSVLESSSALECSNIVDIAENSQQSEVTTLDNIKDTDKALVRSRSLVNSYRPLAFFSALVFTTAQRLCYTLTYDVYSLAQFKELTASLLAKHKNSRPPDDPAACHEHTVNVQRNILTELHHQLKILLQPRHHVLLPLLIGIAQLVASGAVSSEEHNALAEDPTLLKHQLNIDSENRPMWLSQQGWSGAHLLEKLAVFQGLVTSLIDHSEDWREYCEQEKICLTPATPLNPATPLPTPYHTMLLQTALNPHKFSDIVEKFISVTLGPEFVTQKSDDVQSKDLLADVRLLIGMESFSPLLISLRQLLPTPLSDDEITDLAPTSDHSRQSPAACLYDELKHINSLLVSLHSSLQYIEESSTHHSLFSSQATQTTIEISHNTVPSIWHGILPPHLATLPSLLTLLNLLRCGMEYLISVHRSGWSLPLKLHPLWVTNPQDLLSRIQHWVAEQHKLSPNDIMLIAQVDDGSESDSQDHILSFHSLSLCKIPTATPSSSIPVHITLTPHKAVEHTYHQCPVYNTKDRQSVIFHTSFPIPIHAFLHCQL